MTAPLPNPPVLVGTVPLLYVQSITMSEGYQVQRIADSQFFQAMFLAGTHARRLSTSSISMSLRAISRAWSSWHPRATTTADAIITMALLFISMRRQPGMRWQQPTGRFSSTWLGDPYRIL